MSLILDALNKADRQRDPQTPVPNLASYHHEPLAVSSGLRVGALWPVYLVIALLVLVILALALLLFKKEAGQDHRLNSSVQPPHNTSHLNGDAEVTKAGLVSDKKATLQQRAASHEEIVPEELIVDDEVSAIYQHAVSDLQLRQSADQLPSVSLNNQQEPVAKLYGDTSPKQNNTNNQNNTTNKVAANNQQPVPSVNAEQSLPSNQELQAMWNATDQAVLDLQPKITPSDPYKSIPYLHQLPESFKDHIPTVNYQNHIYSPKGAAVILNGKTYRAGDTLAQDLVIDAITQEDLVLSYLQKPFKLAALSSWIQAQ